MAVEVIGERPERFREQVCPKCSYRLRFTPADVREFTSKDISGVSDTNYYIDCPRAECRERIYLSDRYGRR